MEKTSGAGRNRPCAIFICRSEPGSAQARISISVSVRGFGRVGVGKTLAEPADEKLLKDVRSSGCANADQRVFKGQTRTIAVGCGIVEIRDSAGCQASEDA